MSNQFWRNFTNNMPQTLQKLSALCIGAEMLYNSDCYCGMPYSIFPMAYRPYMPYSPAQTYLPYQQYTPYQQYPGYQSPYPAAPGMPSQLQGQITSAEAVDGTHSPNLGRNLTGGDETTFVTDSWKTLNDKTNKTFPEEYQLRGKYMDFLGNLAKSFTSFIDNSQIGNKDGYLSKEEFTSYYMTQLFTPEEIQANDATVQAKKTEAEKIFSSLDLTKEGKLDWKELSSFLALADKSGAGAQYDGTMKNEDILKAFKTVHDGGTTAETTLKQNYHDIFDIRA